MIVRLRRLAIPTSTLIVSFAVLVLAGCEPGDPSTAPSIATGTVEPTPVDAVTETDPVVNDDAQPAPTAGSTDPAKTDDGKTDRSEADAGTTEKGTEKGDVELETSPSDRWAYFRGNRASTGVSGASLPDKLDVVWEYELEKGGFDGAPCIADGVVYLCDWDGRVVAIDLKDGSERWQVKVDDGFTAPPAYADGRLYVGGTYGVFFCFDAKSGETLWTHETGAEINSGANFYEDVVLIGSQDHFLYALDAKSGDLKWKFEIADQIRCTPTIVGSRTFLAGCDGMLHVVDVQQGEALGEVPIGSPTGSTPAAVGDFVYFGTYGGEVHCVNWKTIELVWTYKPERKVEFRGSPAVTKELVVVGSGGRLAVGIDRATGKEKWQYVPDDGLDASPIIVGNRAFFCTTGGKVLALSLDKGEVVWDYELGGSIVASPAVADGRLIVADDDGKVYCLAAPKP